MGKERKGKRSKIIMIMDRKKRGSDTRLGMKKKE